MAFAQAKGVANVATISFYSEEVTIEFAEDMVKSFYGQLGKLSPLNGKSEVENYFKKLERSNYRLFMNNLDSYRAKFQLNDWHYYELLRLASEEVFRGKSKLDRTLLAWFILNKKGFNCRLTFLRNRAFLNIYTNDELYEVPIIEEAGQSFVNLSSFHDHTASLESLYIESYIPNPQGKAFSFDIPTLPKLKSESKERVITFRNGMDTYQMDVNYDGTVISWMQSYRFIAEHKYVEVPLSTVLANSLVPKLKKITQGKSERGSLEILVAFTRSAFEYARDEQYFGKSKPMIPDEVFFYPKSDCEDRSAIFYALVKEVLDLPMIVMAFQDHVTVGVSTTKPIGQAINYNNRRYYVCDPTGPTNSNEIGSFPSGYEEQHFEIICEYK